MRSPALAARVAALEQKVAQLAAQQSNVTTTSDKWLDKVFGVFANDPEFEEAVLSGKEWRRTEVANAEDSS